MLRSRGRGPRRRRVTRSVGSADASVPYRVWIRDGLGDGARGGAAAERPGDARAAVPGMALEPIPAVPSPQPGVTVQRVRRRGGPRRIPGRAGRRWRRAGRGRHGCYRTHSSRMLPSACSRRPSTARPAGTASTVRTGTTVGVYNVNALPWARRRGVGTAATWAARRRRPGRRLRARGAAEQRDGARDLRGDGVPDRRALPGVRAGRGYHVMRPDRNSSVIETIARREERASAGARRRPPPACRLTTSVGAALPLSSSDRRSSPGSRPAARRPPRSRGPRRPRPRWPGGPSCSPCPRGR